MAAEGIVEQGPPDELLARCFESASDGVLLLDRQWRILYLNPSARRMIPMPFAIGECIWDKATASASLGLRERWEQVLAGGISKEFEEFSPLMKQWVEVRACPVEPGLMLMFRPIDRHLHVEQQATETLSRFWSLFENLPEAVTVADLDGLILGANRAAVVMFGCRNEDELKQRICDFKNFELADVDGNVLPLADWPMSRAMRGQTFSDYRIQFRRMDTGLSMLGSCAGTPVFNAAGQVILVVVTVRDITRQVEADRALAASEAFYRALDDFLPHLLWTLTPDLKYQHVNRRWREFTGLTPEQINTDGIGLLIHPDDVERRNAILQRCRETGGTGEIEARYRRSDGVYRWVLARVAPVKDRDGRITQWVATATDIDDLKRGHAALHEAMESLRVSERRFAAFMDHSPVRAWITDEDARVVYFNQAHQVQTDLDPRRDVGRTLFEIFPRELAERYHADNLRVIREGVDLRNEVAVPTKDGPLATHLVIRFPMQADGRTVVGGIAMDITERARIEMELRRSEERLQSILEVASDGVWDLDLRTQIEVWSDRLYELLKVDKATPITREFIRGLFHGDDVARVQEMIDGCLRSGTPFSGEARMRRGDGTWGYFLTRGRVVRDATGVPIRIIGSVNDITNQYQAREALQQAKEAAEAANRAKDQFLAILSHELRTPLTPVLLFSSALERNPQLPEEVRADLALIRQQVQLEARLIDDLLDLTRIQRGKFLLNLADLGLHELLRRVSALAAAETVANGLRLSLDLSADVDHVHGDASRLQQLFGNLIGNAVKFTPSGGSILLRSRNQDGSIVVEISDTGIGIEREAMARIFNAFEQAEQTITRRFGGLGLGLTIGKAIVEHHGGSIDAESAGTGRGTTMRVTLPVRSAPAAPVPPAAPESAPVRQRVLLVEDHEATREILERLLEQAGFDVLPADSVSAALHLGTRQPFDLLLCDIGLPDGTGIDVIARLQPTRTFRAIALSGYGSDEDIARSIAAGFEQHLVKPVDYQRLRQILTTPPR